MHWYVRAADAPFRSCGELRASSTHNIMPAVLVSSGRCLRVHNWIVTRATALKLLFGAEPAFPPRILQASSCWMSAAGWGGLTTLPHAADSKLSGVTLVWHPR